MSHESLYLKDVPRVTHKVCVSSQTDKSNYGGSDELNLPLKQSDVFNSGVSLFKDKKFSVCAKIIQTERETKAIRVLLNLREK